MTSHSTRDGGIKVSEREGSGAMSVDVVKLLKTQDAGYVRTQAAVERRAVEKLEGGLGFMGEGGRHTVFVEGEEEAKGFRAEEYFGTHVELVGRRWNRPRLEQLEGEEARGEKGEERRMEKGREGKYKELEARMKRCAELKVAERELALQRERMGKGGMVGKNKWAKVRRR